MKSNLSKHLIAVVNLACTIGCISLLVRPPCALIPVWISKFTVPNTILHLDMINSKRLYHSVVIHSWTWEGTSVSVSALCVLFLDESAEVAPDMVFCTCTTPLCLKPVDPAPYTPKSASKNRAYQVEAGGRGQLDKSELWGLPGPEFGATWKQPIIPANSGACSVPWRSGDTIFGLVNSTYIFLNNKP